MERIRVLLCLILMGPAILHANQSINDKAGHVAIAATKICGELDLSGSSTDNMIGSKVEAGILGVLKKLFSLNVTGQVEAERLSKEYFNVLHEHLSSELISKRDCRLAVWRDRRCIERNVP